MQGIVPQEKIQQGLDNNQFEMGTHLLDPLTIYEPFISSKVQAISLKCRKTSRFALAARLHERYSCIPSAIKFK
jgi:hypothetical protein